MRCHRFARPASWLTNLGLVLIMCLPGSLRAINFSLHPFTVDEDGYKHTHYSFQYDEHTNVVVDLPRGWSYSDSSAAIMAASPGAAASTVRVEKSAVPPDVQFKDKGLDTYRRRVLADIPDGATGVRISEEHDNPLPIFKWKDYEFVVSYEFYGQAFCRSVVFVDLNNHEQIVETIVASQDVFARVRDAGLDVLRSWQVVPAG